MGSLAALDYSVNKRNVLIRMAVVATIFLIGGGHQIVGHDLIARWFFISGVLFFSAYANWPENWKKFISLVLFHINLGIYFEGTYSGMCEGLMHDDWSAFVVILDKK